MQGNYKLYKGAWIIESDSHLEKQLNSLDKNSLLSKGGIMVRNTYDFDCPEVTSFWYVIKDSFGGMEELSTNTRSKVRRCFKTLIVKRITSEELVEEGYSVYVLAAENYRIKCIPPTIEEFKKRVRNAVENEYWGVFDNTTGKLVAFSMNLVSKDTAEYCTLKAIPEYQKKYAYYGLIYEMNRYYLEELKLRYVNDGARSITEHSNIQPFLIEKFKFRKAYCHLSLHYKWWLWLAVKCLYPFRKVILNGKVKAILNMESMARGDY